MAERTESSIRIDAPPVDVLAVVADVEAYPEWADGISEVTVLQANADGTPDRARFVMASGPVKDSLHVRYSWDTTPDGAGTVSWSLVEPGAMTSLMDGAYVLVPDGDGTTVTYRLAVEVKIKMPGMLRRKAERTIIDAALTDLRARVEG